MYRVVCMGRGKGLLGKAWAKSARSGTCKRRKRKAVLFYSSVLALTPEDTIPSLLSKTLLAIYLMGLVSEGDGRWREKREEMKAIALFRTQPAMTMANSSPLPSIEKRWDVMTTTLRKKSDQQTLVCVCGKFFLLAIWERLKKLSFFCEEVSTGAGSFFQSCVFFYVCS